MFSKNNYLFEEVMLKVNLEKRVIGRDGVGPEHLSIKQFIGHWCERGWLR